MPADLTSLAALAAIIGTVFGIASGGVRFLERYLTARFGKAEMTVAEQSAQCKFDHETIASQMRTQQRETVSMVQAQNEHIARLLEQNGEQLRYMREASHNAELRHQITISKLENIEKIMEKIT